MRRRCVDEKLDYNPSSPEHQPHISGCSAHTAINSQEVFASVIVDKPCDRLIESASRKDPTKIRKQHF
jgi:hypothetical protein